MNISKKSLVAGFMVALVAGCDSTEKDFQGTVTLECAKDGRSGLVAYFPENHEMTMILREKTVTSLRPYMTENRIIHKEQTIDTYTEDTQKDKEQELRDLQWYQKRVTAYCQTGQDLPSAGQKLRAPSVGHPL